MIMGSKETEVSFIICTNNDRYLEECGFYIDKLQVPEGLTVKVIPVRHAKSMTAGYNEAMHASDAKYRIYLHQDMFIVNRRFLYDLLDLFRENDRLAMLGVAGTEHLRDADAWSSLDIGGCYSIGTFSGLGSIAVKPQIRNPQGKYQAVDFIDGMLIATQYDMEWDERIEGFHFYDVSQCERFRKAGYEIGIVRQEDLWSFHDFGPLNLATYRRNQRQFCELYGYQRGSDDDETQIYEMCETVAGAVRECFNRGELDRAREILAQVGGAIYFDQDLLTAAFALEILALEELTEDGKFLQGGELGGFCSAENRWMELRLLLIRVVFGGETTDTVAEKIISGEFSTVAVITGILHNVPVQHMSQMDRIGEILDQKGALTVDTWMKRKTMVQEYESLHLPSADGL